MKKKFGGVLLAGLIGFGSAGVALPEAQANEFELPDVKTIIEITNAKADLKEGIRTGNRSLALGAIATYNGAVSHYNDTPGDDDGTNANGNEESDEEIEQPEVDPTEEQ